VGLVGLRGEVRWLREQYAASQQRACGLMAMAVSSYRYRSRLSEGPLSVFGFFSRLPGAIE